MLPNKFVKTRPGFGLLEALIASGIIVMVSAASVGLANGIIRSTKTFDDKIVADNLASEALESAHWMRDYYLNDSDVDTSWDRGFKDDAGNDLLCNTDGNGMPCDVDRSNIGDPAYPLKFINKTGADDTININNHIYIRKIWIIKTDPDGNMYNIHVKVFDEAGLALPTPEPLSDLQTVLTNWKEPR